MLLGKLSSPAVKVFQSGPFNTTTVNAEYMVVYANNYVIGSSSTTFEVRFGNVLAENENEKERFDIVLRESIKMTSDELSTWGTDDSVVLDLIAIKLGNSITEKITKDFHPTY
jgi:hypothetical protein